MPDTIGRPWWRRVRISLRTSLCVVLLLGGGLGWMLHRVKIEHQAVAAIERAGGSVLYEWQYRKGVTFTRGKPNWPDWLVDRLGIDFFGNVVFVFLPEGGTNAEMAQVGQLGHLQRLWVRSPHVTDAGLAHIAGLTHLEDLMFANSPISDVGIARLAGLSRLKRVSFADTRVSNAGVSRLKAHLTKASILR